jgi:APA family basic amino acid/polyamine antiporter
MVSNPRLTFALAEGGDFPHILAAVHRKFRTPHVSIVFFALLAWILAVAGTFRWNLTLSAVARLFTYASTCAAIPVLRRKRPSEPAFLLPAGNAFAFLGIAFSVVLATRMGRGELAVIVVTGAIALANWLWVRRKREA